MNFRIKDNLKNIAIFAAVLISVLAGVYLSFRLAFFLLPFLIAFALSILMEPLIKFITKRLHIKRKIAAPIVLLLMLASIIFLIVMAVLRLITEIKVLVALAPGFFSTLYALIIDWTKNSSILYEWLPADITDNLGSVIANISNSITTIGKSIVKGAYTTAISFPEALVFTIITILATYFMSSDREKITSVITHHLPESWMNRILSIKKDMFSALFGYMRAALIMMSITFAELFLGFSIIKIQYSLLLAFIIALFDALPVLGAGGILVPWALFSFVTNDIRMGVSIIVLYLIVLIVRQILEPKIVGDQIGVYPLLTLIAMYTGLSLIGFAGLIIGPITFLLIRNIIITIYKNKSFKEIIGYGSAAHDKRKAEQHEEQVIKPEQKNIRKEDHNEK